MSINQNEANLEALTVTIAYLKKRGNCDKKLLKELEDERDRILKELNVHSP